MTDAVMDQVESKADAATQARAETMGWIPPERFKGDPAGFVDADKYIERGEQVLPIVQANNKRLNAELATMKVEQAKTATALAAAQKALDEIEIRNSVQTQKAVARATAEVKAQLARASEAGDHAGVAELTDQLVELKDAAKEAAAPPVKQTPVAAAYTPDADLVAFQEANSWFGTDRRKTALAMGIAAELRETTQLKGADFYKRLSEEMNKELGAAERERPADKVEGGRNGSDAEPARGAKGKSYAALPAEARAACDADAKKFVGKGKRFESIDAWRADFARIYNEM